MLWPSEVLPTPGGPDQAQDRALELLHALLHREVLDDALLDLLEAEVVLVQHLLCAGEVVLDLGALAPRRLHQPVDVVADDRGLGGHRRHQLQLRELGVRLLARLLRHARARDLLLELGDLVGRVVHLAQLLLDRLHLLVEVVLALALLHLLLDAATDALLDLQHVDLALDQREDVLEAAADVLDLEDLLLGVELERHVRRDRVGEPPGLLDAGERGQDLGRHLAVELHVLLELRDHRAHQHVHLALVVGLAFADRAGLGGEVVAGDELLDLRALDAFDEHLDRAVGQLQQLQDARDRADVVEVLRRGVVDVGLLLREQQDLLVDLHRLLEREDRALAADEQRDHHVRVDHHVAQRQDRQHVGRIGGLRGGFCSRHVGCLRRRRRSGGPGGRTGVRSRPSDAPIFGDARHRFNSGFANRGHSPFPNRRKRRMSPV